MTDTLSLEQRSSTTDTSPSNVLKNRNFRMLWIGEGISLLGDQFYLIALPWLVAAPGSPASAAARRRSARRSSSERGGLRLRQAAPALSRAASPAAGPSGETFYRLAAGERFVWAFVAGRSKVCNVCHDIFFIVVFDDGGTVVGLEPITITKYKNVEFDEKDVAFLRGRVVGRALSRDIVFDPTVDAVSTATMSSALVFDTLRRLGETWRSMVAAGKAQP